MLQREISCEKEVERWPKGRRAFEPFREFAQKKESGNLVPALFVQDWLLRLALGELEPLAGAGLAGLFALAHARVAGEESLLFKRNSDRFIDLEKRAAQGETHRASLAVDSAAGCLNDNIVGMDRVRNLERTKDLVLKRKAAEIIGEIAPVDLDGPGAGLHAQAGNSSLSTACGNDGVIFCAHAEMYRAGMDQAG